ncbi:hypothetical protein BV898_01581 [Hypsibius exemplaris]|uniref:Uncharacterized protein n=1 Tax=Hypsibius exemplaris TaxID=2072580 RepID=A0A1W0XAF9_HYPEX|nr:hypothetical protein BV898_01581 [Hypsibius exemplaris]
MIHAGSSSHSPEIFLENGAPNIIQRCFGIVGRSQYYWIGAIPSPVEETRGLNSPLTGGVLLDAAATKLPSITEIATCGPYL